MAILRNAIKPNRLGYIRQLDISYDVHQGHYLTHAAPFVHQSGLMTINLEIVAPSSSPVMELVDSWARGGEFSPTYHSEYMCLYCASPNKIEFSHCGKCGAPRSFVIG